MDLAIRIELYMNFAITPSEKSELYIRLLTQVTVAEKVVSEVYKNIGVKIGTKNRHRKIYMRN
jgi:hypothetical protein